MFFKLAVIETEFLAKIESKLFEIAEVEIFSLLKLISIERTYAKLPFFLSNFDVVDTGGTKFPLQYIFEFEFSNEFSFLVSTII